MIQMPSEKQINSILDSNKRINLWEGAVRSGKTIASILRWLEFVAGCDHGKLIMVGKTERTLKGNVLDPMAELLGDDEYSARIGAGEITLYGRDIEIVGANDERSEQKIRGRTFRGAYCDEATLYPQSFWMMLLSRLSSTGAKMFATMNPDNPYHWMKKDYINRRDELDLAVFSFVIDDNPYLDPIFVANLKKEFTGLWYKRFILGQWVMAEGVIYDMFDDKNIKVIDDYPAIYYVAGADYGTGNPTAFGLYAVNKNMTPKIYKVKEYYYDSKLSGRQKTDAEYSKDFIKFIDGVFPLKGIYIDPSAASFRAQLIKDGVSGITSCDNDVLEGIKTQSMLLENEDYAIHPSCRQTIQDYYAYSWDKNAQKKGEDKPLKQYDHTKDEERYVLHSLMKGGAQKNYIVGRETRSSLMFAS